MSRKAVVHISLNRRAVPKIIAYHFHSHVNIYIHMPTPRVSQTYALYSLQYKVRTPPPTPPVFREAQRSLCYRSPFQQTGNFFDCLVSRTLMVSNLILH